MRNINRDNITEAVIGSFSGAESERLRLVLSRLITHLHDFAREVELTPEEWKAGIDFLYRAGRISDEARNEFILTSDVLGLSSLVDLLQGAAGATERSALGPFHAEGAPALPVGGDLIRGNRGEPLLVRGRVLGEAGAPVAGAHLDFWQAAANGLYWQQDPEQRRYNLYCTMNADEQGRYAFTTIRPAPYTVPYDGPVGELLRAGGRRAWRPAHLHFIVSARGHRTLTTELFLANDPHLEHDAVFGVRDGLVLELERGGTEADARAYGLTRPFAIANFDFRLHAL